jgi:hypothetical protein
VFFILFYLPITLVIKPTFFVFAQLNLKTSFGFANDFVTEGASYLDMVVIKL